jgi:hypothetical protein
MHSKKLLTAVTIACLLIFACMMNPSADMHRTKINCMLVEPMQCEDVYSQMNLAYQNCLLCSVSFPANKPGEIATLGIFGKVFLIKDFGILKTPQIM